MAPSRAPQGRDRLASEAMLSFYEERRNWRMNGDRFSYHLGHHGGCGAVYFRGSLAYTAKEKFENKTQNFVTD